MTQFPGTPPPPPPGGTYPGGWAPPPSHGTNGLAVAALICGLFWIGGIGSLLGVIFGIVALSQIRQRGGAGRGMAIAGIVLGGLGIVATIAAALLAVAFVSEVSESVDTKALAAVEIETSSPDVCWKAEVLSGDRLRSEGESSVNQDGCGPSRLELGRGLLRVAEVTKTSGAGTLTAVLTLDGAERDRQTTDGSKPLTVTPFSQLSSGKVWTD